MATDESPKGFDIDSLKSDDTTEIELVHPATGEELGIKITVYGQDSEVFRAESRKVQNACARYMQKNRGKSIPPEDFERLDKTKVIACVKIIHGMLCKGVPVTDAEEMFNLVPDFYEQVVRAIMDRANFIKG